MFHKLSNSIQAVAQISISSQRKVVLQPLVEYIQNKVANHEEVRLNFICTHNSRRSHLAQIWAQTMAFQFGIKNVFAILEVQRQQRCFQKFPKHFQIKDFKFKS